MPRAKKKPPTLYDMLDSADSLVLEVAERCEELCTENHEKGNDALCIRYSDAAQAAHNIRDSILALMKDIGTSARLY